MAEPRGFSPPHSAARGRSAGLRLRPTAFLIPRYLLHLHLIENLLQRKAQSPQNPYSNRLSALQPWSAGLDRHGGGVFGEGISRKLTLSIRWESKQRPMSPGPGSRILKSVLPPPRQDSPGRVLTLPAGLRAREAPHFSQMGLAEQRQECAWEPQWM